MLLVSAVHHHESAIGIPLSPNLPLHPTPLGCHRASGWDPCIIQQIPSSYLLSIWKSLCFSYYLNLSSPLLPLLCPQVSSLCLCLYCCTKRFISTIFLGSIYIHLYVMFVFLFLTYFILYYRLYVHPSHQM